MADRKKVIEGLECCTSGECCTSDCPYFKEFPMTDGRCITVLQADALSLLKEQEPVPPIKQYDGNPKFWTSWWYVFGNCETPIDCCDKFCRRCGRMVKWE